MPQRNVATNFTFEQQRAEINLLAQDYWTFQGSQTTLNSSWLKLDGSNAFTGGTLAVPNAFTINSNSGAGTVTIAGNLQVDGTTTTVNTATMDVVDKNITIAKGSANDAAADGAGITIDSATDITFNFVDAKDALVSSIGLEATTFLKAGTFVEAARGQFIGATSPTAGSGVEINAPDANTGQIIAYNRGTSTYNPLNIKAASVPIYTGTTNALAGTFNSTGLTMESGKTITGNVTGNLTGNVTGNLTGNVTGDLTGTASKVNLTSNNDNSSFRVIFASGNSGSVDLYADNNNGMTYNPSTGLLYINGTMEANSFSGDGSNLTGIAAGGATIADAGNANANSTVLFSANASGSNQTLSTDGGLLYNAAEDALKVNGTIITSAGITGAGGSCIVAAANHSSTCKITVGQDVQVIGKFIQGATSTNSNTIFHTEGSASVGAEFIGNNTQEGFYLALRNKNTNNDAWTTIQSWDAGGAIVSSIRFVQVNDANNQGAIAFRTRDTGGSETERLRITPGGNAEPGADNTYNLGSASKRWANVYTGDMHLNNMNSGGNEVDGSEGHWTMQEGSDDLFLINRNTGKKYKFNLTEVS